MKLLGTSSDLPERWAGISYGEFVQLLETYEPSLAFWEQAEGWAAWCRTQ